MSLKEQIQQQMKDAMRAKQQHRLTTIRLLIAAIKQREIDEKITLTDTDIINVMRKMIKQRLDSHKQFEAAGRQELAEKEADEIKVIEEFLPEQMSDAEMTQLVEAAVKESGAKEMRDMGAVMAILKPKVEGRADMGALSAKVKALLNHKRR